MADSGTFEEKNITKQLDVAYEPVWGSWTILEACGEREEHIRNLAASFRPEFKN